MFDKRINMIECEHVPNMQKNRPQSVQFMYPIGVHNLLKQIGADEIF